MNKHVLIHSGNDYGKTAISSTYGALDGVYCFHAPMERFSGIPLLLYKAHNSRKINNIIRLPLRKQWAKFFLPKSVKSELLETEQIVFHFSGNGYTYRDIGLYEYLRKKYPNCKLIYKLSDRVSVINKRKEYNLAVLCGIFDFICTYNDVDAEDYSLKLRPPTLLDYSYVPNDPSIPETDVFFIGREKGRLDRILNVYKVCTDNGLKCDFHITEVPEDRQLYADHIVYNRYMAYDDAMKRARRAKCIVNLVQDNVSGITLRDFEAVSMNKLLLTDNVAIKDFPCYNEAKVIMYDELEKSLYKLNADLSDTQWYHLDEYSARAYFDWVERQLEL